MLNKKFNRKNLDLKNIKVYYIKIITKFSFEEFNAFILRI